MDQASATTNTRRHINPTIVHVKESKQESKTLKKEKSQNKKTDKLISENDVKNRGTVGGMGGVRFPQINGESPTTDPPGPPGADSVAQYDDVRGILEAIESAQLLRRQIEIRSKMGEIHGRIKHALAYFGISTKLELSPEEIAKAEEFYNRRPGSDFKMKRERKLYKKRFLESISQYLVRCEQRRGILEEVELLLKGLSSTLTGPEFTAAEESEQCIAACLTDVHKYMMTTLSSVIHSTDKINRLGNTIFDQIHGGLSSRSRAPQPVGKGRVIQKTHETHYDKIEIFDCAALSVPENWKVACQVIRKSLDDGTKLAKNNLTRSAFRSTVKQFSYLIELMESRIESVHELQQQLLSVQFECQHATGTVERLTVNIQDKDTKINSLQVHNTSLNKNLEEIRISLDKAQATIADLRRRNATAQQQTTQSSNLSPEELDKKIRNSKIFKDIQDELKTSVNKIIALRAEIGSLKIEMKSQKDISETLSKELQQYTNIVHEMSDKNDTENELDDANMMVGQLTRQLEACKENLKRKIDHIKILESKISELQSESTRMGSFGKELELATATLTDKDNKQILGKLKNEFDALVTKMQSHYYKEKQRSDASVRRIEQDHKTQLTSIHKESIHLLRTINRFKESMASIIEKEGMPDIAHEIRQLPTLNVSEAPNDAKMTLFHMAGSAVELLVALEFRLSHVLMTKRVQKKAGHLNFLKSQSNDPSVKHRSVDDLQKQKITKLKEELWKAEKVYTNMRSLDDDKYRKLSDRYKQIARENANLKRDIVSIEDNYKEQLKTKDLQLRSIDASRANMRRSLDEKNSKITESQLTDTDTDIDTTRSDDSSYLEILSLNKKEHEHNINKLDVAMASNRITTDIYQTLVSLVYRTMGISEIKLRHLMTKYIMYRCLTDAKHKLAECINNAGTRAPALVTMMSRIEAHKLNCDRRWTSDQAQLQREQNELMRRMNIVFQEIDSDGSFLLIRPYSKQGSRIPRLPPLVSDYKHAPVTWKYTPNRVGYGDMRDTLKGVQINLIGETGDEQWTMPREIYESYVNTIQTTPRILELDVNHGRRMALSTLTALSGRQPPPSSSTCTTRSKSQMKPMYLPSALMYPPLQQNYCYHYNNT